MYPRAACARLLGPTGRPRTLPLPATYVIGRDRDRVIRWAFVNTDYTTRAEPADILAALDAPA